MRIESRLGAPGAGRCFETTVAAGHGRLPISRRVLRLDWARKGYPASTARQFGVRIWNRPVPSGSGGAVRAAGKTIGPEQGRGRREQRPAVNRERYRAAMRLDASGRWRLCFEGLDQPSGPKAGISGNGRRVPGIGRFQHRMAIAATDHIIVDGGPMAGRSNPASAVNADLAARSQRRRARHPRSEPASGRPPAGTHPPWLETPDPAATSSLTCRVRYRRNCAEDGTIRRARRSCHQR